MERWRTDFFIFYFLSEMTLYNTIVMDTWHHTFVQTHRMYSTMHEPTLGDNDVYLF